MRQKTYENNIDKFINHLNSFYTGKIINKSFLYPVLPEDKEIKSLYRYLESNFN